MRHTKKDEGFEALMLCLLCAVIIAAGCVSVMSAKNCFDDRVDHLLSDLTNGHRLVVEGVDPYDLRGEEKFATHSAAPAPVTPEMPELTLDCCETTYLRADVPLTLDEQRDLYGACLEFDIPYDLALSLIEQESDFRNIMGDDGKSAGYMQVQRRWWSDLMDDIGAEDLTVPRDNFRTGCAILRHLLDRFDGSVEDALTAYNSGSGGSSRYADDIMGRLK